MKKTLRTVGLILIAMMSFSLIACGGDDKEGNDVSEIQLAYQKTKASIVGTWILEAKYNQSVGPGSLGGVYNKLGWDDNDEYGFFKINPYYKFDFKSDGTFEDKDGDTYKYTIDFDEKNYVIHTKSDFEDYWPFEKGAITLRILDDLNNNFYINEFYVNIGTDGMLYFYETGISGEGYPKYRYRKQ